MDGRSSEERANHVFLVCCSEAPPMSQILPPKKDVALALLERASVFVHLDPRGVGVVVPIHFKKQPRLVLQIGLNMAVPIPDLRLDDQGLSCTLSFNRSLFHCVVPWSGIFALVGEDGRGMVWPDDVPQEIAREMAPQKDEGGKPEGAAPAGPTGVKGPTGVPNPRKRPQMTLLGGGAGAGGGSGAGASAGPSSGGGAEKRPAKRGGQVSRGGAAGKRKRDDADKPTLFKVDSEQKTDKGGKASKPGAPVGIGRASLPLRDRDAQGPKAVPPPAPSEKRVDGNKSKNEAPPSKPASPEKIASKAPAVSPSSPPAPSSPGSPSSAPPGKRSPKRELPPYLRVVK